jgi:2-aminoadipate transaminase
MEYRITSRMKNAQGSIIRELLKLAGEPGMISFGGGSPAPAAFPAEDIARIAHEALTGQAVRMLQYGISEGYPPLVKTMKEHLLSREGISFENNDLLIVSGGQQCADLTAKLFANEGDLVIVESPSFVGCLNAFRSYGAQLIGVPLMEDGVDLARLEEAFRLKSIGFFYTIPTFQNPTGITTTLEKRRQIYRLAQQYNVIILEDNPYGELRFEGDKVPAYKSIDTDGRVIYAGSFSKTLTPGMRVGFLVIDKALFNRFKIAKQAADVHSSTLYQYVCNEYLTKCDYDAHIREICALYREKSALMVSELQKKLHPAVRITKPQGGLFLMAYLPSGMDSLPFVQEGIKRKVITVPGSAFATDPSLPDNSIRLNFSMPTREQIVAGVDILGKLSHEVLGS